jgi:hypothetical protein
MMIPTRVGYQVLCTTSSYEALDVMQRILVSNQLNRSPPDRLV